ncbi:hypothetical protein [Okeania sp. SIO2B3]|uniref:hypothetical protein n=1 Tax=Okeania sp. SIO2B3 TaxID=2607784 RepID=UPI0013C10D37|nr:hypothetical protein [Okeania sp. SIO2B3]NET45561.1 hypothetical protein [Okeania sp. SIO2B3]
MDPITIALIIIGSFLAGAGGIYGILEWKHILIELKGKKLAVLGAKGTGKTTLLNYVIKGILSEGYHQTKYAKPTDERRFILDKNTWISLKKSTDLGGDTSFRTEWQSLFEDSDLVFYLVRADLLIKNDQYTQSRVEKDLGFIQSWWQSYDSKNKKKFFNKKKKKLLIICTFCDEVDQLQRGIPRMIGNDELRKIFPLLHKYSTGIKVVLGSLLTNGNKKFRWQNQIFW